MVAECLRSQYIGFAPSPLRFDRIPLLTADGTDAKAKEVCGPLGLSVRGTGGEHTPIGADGTVDISPSARFCITEGEIVTALFKGISLLVEKEKAAAAAK